jgi:hypothetical protein
MIDTICKEIKKTSQIECDVKEIGDYWWKVLSKEFKESHGSSFMPQRKLELHSLNETIIQFQSTAKSDKLVEKQYAYWQKPEIFKDTIPFMQSIDIPVYVLSNIDTDDVMYYTLLNLMV